MGQPVGQPPTWIVFGLAVDLDKGSLHVSWQRSDHFKQKGETAHFQGIHSPWTRDWTPQIETGLKPGNFGSKLFPILHILGPSMASLSMPFQVQLLKIFGYISIGNSTLFSCRCITTSTWTRCFCQDLLGHRII